MVRIRPLRSTYTYSAQYICRKIHSLPLLLGLLYNIGLSRSRYTSKGKKPPPGTSTVDGPENLLMSHGISVEEARGMDLMMVRWTSIVYACRRLIDLSLIAGERVASILVAGGGQPAGSAGLHVHR